MVPDDTAFLASDRKGTRLPELAVMAERLRIASTVGEVSSALEHIARDLGFSFHALVHHADLIPYVDGFLPARHAH